MYNQKYEYKFFPFLILGIASLAVSSLVVYNKYYAPIDCKVSDWKNVSDCNKQCGGGTLQQQREILVSPMYAGKACPSDLTRELVCNDTPCPEDCQMSEWINEGECSKSCGSGIQKQIRKIVQEKQHGGKECPLDLTREITCNEHQCPIDCQVGEWINEGECSAQCGGGILTQKRGILQPSAFGGKECPPLTQQIVCNEQPCPIDCQVGEWSEWSQCDAKCGEGNQIRTRNVVVPPQYGGKECSALSETKFCVQQPCEPSFTTDNYKLNYGAQTSIPGDLLPNPVIANNYTFTIEFKIKYTLPSTSGTWYTLLSKKYEDYIKAPGENTCRGDFRSPLFVLYELNGKLFVRIRIADKDDYCGGPYQDVELPQLQTDKYYYLTITVKDKDVNVFLNEALLGSRKLSNSPYELNRNYPLLVSASSTTINNIDIKKVMYWNKVISVPATWQPLVTVVEPYMRKQNLIGI